MNTIHRTIDERLLSWLIDTSIPAKSTNSKPRHNNLYIVVSSIMTIGTWVGPCKHTKDDEEL